MKQNNLVESPHNTTDTTNRQAQLTCERCGNKTDGGAWLGFVYVGAECLTKADQEIHRMKKRNDVTEFPAQLPESELMKFTTYEQYEAWKQCAELAYAFLDSLPHGWLAHTSGDIGALNDFYIKYREASHLSNPESNTAPLSPKNS